MRMGLIGCALTVAAALVPATAMADDPRDPTMRTAAARARDRAIIKQMNQQQLAYVRKRDARNQRTYRVADEDRRAYDNARADHARDMAAWRRAVAACNGGQWEYCGN